LLLHNKCSPLRIAVITVVRPISFFRASVFFAAFGALVSISGCVADPAGEYGTLGYAGPYYGPGYVYSPGFGYSDFGLGLGFEDHFHHFDHNFDHRHFDNDHRLHADHRFHGQAMTGETGHPGSFHLPPGEFHGRGPHPGFGGGGGSHARAANPAPAPHPGGAHGNFNH